MNITSAMRQSIVRMWLALLLFVPFAASAELSVPLLTGRVIDQTGTLTSEQKISLEQTLTAFESQKGSQLAVLIVPTTAPETIEQFALRVAERWKLGRKRVDDGAILIMAKNDRTLRIEVGYGLEGALTDATSNRIISETILPRFKQQDFYGGIATGVAQIISVIEGEPLPTPKIKPRGNIDALQQYALLLFIVTLGVGGMLRNILGKITGSLLTGGVVAVTAWFIVGTLSITLLSGVAALLFTLLGGGMVRHGLGAYYGGGLGSGRSGGFSGGGGGFGGGGASGRW